MSSEHTVVVREVPIEKAVEVTKTINEFDAPYDKTYFEDRYQGRDRLVIVGYIDEQPVGYIVGYDRDQDGSFYCWMAAVNPKFRRLGVLTALMNYENNWARAHGYKMLRIKTRNNRREMLANLVKNGFLFTEVSPQPDVRDNRISLELPF
jgi:ribosomal protein S18 acetylase RimI-like enzyme